MSGPSTPLTPPPAFQLPIGQVDAGGRVLASTNQAQFQQQLWAYVQTLVEAQTSVTVPELPTGDFAGQTAVVTDSTVAPAGHFGAAVVGGGTFTTPVFWNGAAWLIG